MPLADLRYALSFIRRQRRRSLLVVLLLALGTGASTAIFSLLYQLLIRPLPFDDPGKLVALTDRAPALSGPVVASPIVAAWRSETDLLQGVAAYMPGTATLTGHGPATRIEKTAVTVDFLPLLGVQPILGRGFTAQEGAAGTPRAAIVAYRVWAGWFALRPDVLGRPLVLDGQPCTIVGVLPSHFRFPGSPDPDVLVPLSLSPAFAPGSPLFFVNVIARLRPDAPLGTVRSRLAAVSHRVEDTLPAGLARLLEGSRVEAVPLQRYLAGDRRHLLLVLFASVGCIVLIACANIASLHLNWYLDRQRELAVRAALGATRARLLAQVAAESLIVSIAGALAGFGLARLLLGVMTRLDGAFVLDSGPLLAGPAFVFAVALSVISGGVAAVAPAVVTLRADLVEAMSPARQPFPGTRHRSLARPILLGTEIALAVALSIGSGLLLRTTWALSRIDPGFDPRSVLAARITLPADRYPAPEQQTVFFERLLDRLRRLPSAASVAAADVLPLRGLAMTVPAVSDVQEGPLESPPQIAVSSVTPGYFSTMRIPLLSGRDFDRDDRSAGPGVAIVNDALARRFFRGRPAVGRRIRMGDAAAPWLTVVGVAGDVRQLGLESAVAPQVFLPVRQVPRSSLALVIRAHADPLRIVPAVRAEVFALDSNQPLENVVAMEQVVSGLLAPRRTVMLLLVGLAMLALMLAVSGVYGLTEHAVRQRRHEVAVRVALGAQRRDLLWLLARRVHVVTLAGVAVGVACAVVFTRWMSSLLFGVTPLDAPTFLVAAGVMVVTAVLGAHIPARRALAQNPALTLRAE